MTERKDIEIVEKSAKNGGRFQKGNTLGKKFSKEYQPQNLKLKRAIKKAFQQVAQERLEDLQDYATLQMSEWVIKRLDDIDTLTTTELEKIQKFLEFLRDSSGQKPTEKQEITNTTPQIIVANIEDKNLIEDI